MKLFIIGADEQGRSCVSSAEELPVSPEEDLLSTALWTTEQLPAEVVKPRPAGGDAPLVFTPTTTGSLFHLGQFAPGYESPVHHTDTLDYGLVLDGSVTLVLETEEVTLSRGDHYVLPGLVHQWKAGADGTTLVTVLLGFDDSHQ